MTEADVRLDILRSILRSPHGKVEDLANLHKSAQEIDPLFYAHFAVWYQQKKRGQRPQTLVHRRVADFT